MTWKAPVFDIFYVIFSTIFEDIDLKFCAHIHQQLPSNILYVLFFNLDFEGEHFEKEKKMLTIFEILGNFQHCQNPR